VQARPFQCEVRSSIPQGDLKADPTAALTLSNHQLFGCIEVSMISGPSLRYTSRERAPSDSSYNFGIFISFPIIIRFLVFA
jgi:hypothetical protein